jgi:SNF family Na+-dependent transporter
MSQGGKEAWGTRIGVILAVTGSAVGLGNFLRFPGKAAQYEGGTFMIPYFVALLLLGLPIAWVEWAMGRYGGVRGFNSYPGIFRLIWRHRVSPYLGAFAVLIPVAIYMYYVYIEAWCLGYAWKFATGQMAMGSDPKAYSDFFATFTGAAADGAAFDLSDGAGQSALSFLAVCFVLNFLLIYRGLSKGIEMFCLYAMPALVVCALVVLVRVMTLDTPDPLKPDQNLLNGLGFMWNPATKDKTFWESLMNAQMWLEAAGQIFFSLSVGFGIMVCYASYLRKNDDIALSSMTACAGNEFCEVALGGLITIPAAFMFLGAAGAQGGTFALGFNTLPLVFNAMPLGQFVGAVFFFLLFLAAITSSLSMLQPAIALIEEGLGVDRKSSVTILGLVTAMGSAFVVYFSKGLTALDTIDFWIGSFSLYVLAAIEVVFFGWILGIDKGHEELSRGAAMKVPRFVMYVIKYVSPIYLLAVFVAWAWQNSGQYLDKIVNDKATGMTVGLIVLVLIFFILLVGRSVRRWERIEAGPGRAKP